MKTFGIEYLHTKLNRHIKLVASYLDKPEIDFIIRATRLKPYRLFFEQYDERLVLLDWWFDEYGNSLVFNKKKKLRIIEGDLRLDRERIVQTDLYGSLDLSRVSQFSKLAYYLVGYEDERRVEILALYGIDGFLRTFVNQYGTWETYPSLLLGLDTLKFIFNNRDLRLYAEQKNIKNITAPCQRQRAFVSSWPPTKNFALILSEQNGSVLDMIKGI